jgi:hypothetical protein
MSSKDDFFYNAPKNSKWDTNFTNFHEGRIAIRENS